MGAHLAAGQSASMGPPLALLDIGDCPLPTEKFSPTHASPMESVGSASVDGLSDGIFRGEPSPLPKHALKNQTKSSSHIALQPTSYQSGIASASRGSPQEPLKSPSSFSKKTHASSFSTLLASHSGAGSLDSSPVTAEAFSCSSGDPKETSNIGKSSRTTPEPSKKTSVPTTQKPPVESLEEIEEVRSSCSSNEILLDMPHVESTTSSAAGVGPITVGVGSKSAAQRQQSWDDQPLRNSKLFFQASLISESSTGQIEIVQQKQKLASDLSTSR